MKMRVAKYVTAGNSSVNFEAEYEFEEAAHVDLLREMVRIVFTAGDDAGKADPVLVRLRKSEPPEGLWEGEE